MARTEILSGKKLLIVDDEPDILETLQDLLDACLIDTAPNYETAVKFLGKEHYDAAIFDIMGVQGYELLKLAAQKNIPALMLTAHALNPEALVESLKTGAQAYIPKEKMSDIDIYLAEMFQARSQGIARHANWYVRLKSFFDSKFGPDWHKTDPEFWQAFDRNYVVTQKELEQML
jgi:DNA-binding NtrC family response regulator